MNQIFKDVKSNPTNEDNRQINFFEFENHLIPKITYSENPKHRHNHQFLLKPQHRI
jgi:hypothetical protein